MNFSTFTEDWSDEQWNNQKALLIGLCERQQQRDKSIRNRNEIGTQTEPIDEKDNPEILQAKIDVFRKQYIDLTSRKNQLYTKQEKLIKTNNKLKAKVLTNATTIDDLQKQNDENLQKYNSIEKELQQITETNEKNMEILYEENSRMKKFNIELAIQRDNLENDLKHKQDEIQHLRMEVDEKNQRIQDSKATFETFKKGSEQERKELILSNVKFIDQNTELLAKIRQHEFDIQILKSELDDEKRKSVENENWWRNSPFAKKNDFSQSTIDNGMTPPNNRIKRTIDSDDNETPLKKKVMPSKNDYDSEAPIEKAKEESPEYVLLFVVRQNEDKVLFHVKMDLQLGKLKRCYSEKIGMAIKDLKFLFNGHCIDNEDTPHLLQMKDHNCIEVFLEQGGPPHGILCESQNCTPNTINEN